MRGNLTPKLPDDENLTPAPSTANRQVLAVYDMVPWARTIHLKRRRLRARAPCSWESLGGETLFLERGLPLATPTPGMATRKGKECGQRQARHQQPFHFCYVHWSWVLCTSFAWIVAEEGTIRAPRANTSPQQVLTAPSIMSIFVLQMSRDPRRTCSRFLLATNTSLRASSTQKHDAPLVDGTLANGR